MKLPKKTTPKTNPVEVMEMYQTQLKAVKNLIETAEEDLKELRQQKRDIELKMFYETTPYRDGDIVKVILPVRGKKIPVIAKLGLTYEWKWQFLAYPQKKDSEEFSSKYNIVYDIEAIQKKV